MLLTKHRFIPLGECLPEYREEWDRVLVKCYEPRFCVDCDELLDVTEDRQCVLCNRAEWEQNGPHDWEPEE